VINGGAVVSGYCAADVWKKGAWGSALGKRVGLTVVLQQLKAGRSTQSSIPTNKHKGRGRRAARLRYQLRGRVRCNGRRNLLRECGPGT
jgi:hypothetical protein